MMTLENLELIKLMPLFMRTDPFVMSVCEVLSPYFHQLDYETKRYLVNNRIDDMTEEELDLFAVDERITWYNTADKIEIKRAVIKKAVEIQKLRGTTAAIEEAASVVFGKSTVEEWHEYDGEPNCFRIRTTNTTTNNQMTDRFMQIVNSLKRVTAKLDQVIIQIANEMKVRVVIVTHIYEKTILR